MNNNNNKKEAVIKKKAVIQSKRLIQIPQWVSATYFISSYIQKGRGVSASNKWLLNSHKYIREANCYAF